jgi:hypothetical protein
MVVRSQLVRGAQERSPLIDVFASRIDRKALAYRLFHRFTGGGVLFLPCTAPLVFAGVALFGRPGGEVFGPVVSCVADPADSRVDVHAEEVGQDCGGEMKCHPRLG